MELYNSIIRKVEELAGSSTPRRCPYDPQGAWEDTGSFELVMLRDAAYELGGSSKPAVNFICVTTSAQLVEQDEILVFGPDLTELRGDSAYARIALLRVGDIESDDEDDTEQAFRAIQDMREIPCVPQGIHDPHLLRVQPGAGAPEQRRPEKGHQLPGRGQRFHPPV